MARVSHGDEFARAIGRRLREARIAKGLSQGAAGTLAGFGAEDPQSRVSHYERARRPIALADLASLARVYGVNPAFLAFGELSLPEDEENLLRDYRNAPEDTKRILRAILDASMDTGKASKKGRARPG